MNFCQQKWQRFRLLLKCHPTYAVDSFISQFFTFAIWPFWDLLEELLVKVFAGALFLHDLLLLAVEIEISTCGVESTYIVVRMRNVATTA